MFKIELCIKVGQKMCKRTIKCLDNLQLSLQIWRQIKKMVNLVKTDKFASTSKRENLATTAGKRQFCTNTNKGAIWHQEHKQTIGNDVWTILNQAAKEEFMKASTINTQ